ncbi:glucose 1-dehydrogenase [Aerococcaceae bacterium DSM 109653]|uniref:Glucose 1-dehydrogenase n=1 Tax=Fundicoccus ignavus TaxID=2664442 RepID=A0A844BXI6_9LACT|nr:SDR family NAD(P)-dependent oxidoreductase [Fundicoccus ignavus]MRI82623.1 glucose 1-dehydrogenase [Fundicoccus ignavus]
MEQFKEKVIVVTGAAKGIGKEIAIKFAQNGGNIVIVDLDQVAGELLANELSVNYQKSIFVKADVSSYKDAEAVRDATFNEFGRIDVLVLNAGISKKKTIDQISSEEFRLILDVNLNGTFYSIKSFYEDFKTNQGKIVFITSGSGITGTGGGAHYAASKSGQHGLMRTVSKELGPFGVNVNAIAPRVIETDLFDTLYPTEESRKELMAKIPIGRFGQSEDIANLAIFLAAKESSYIHGQIILADGGRTL